MNKVLHIENFDRFYLDKSYEWLQNPLLLSLIDSEPVSKEAQEKWFLKLPQNKTYKIWGVSCNNEPYGVCGIRSINGSSGELFCYIGDQSQWGGGTGNQLVKLVEDEAMSLGLCWLTLKVLHDNERAKRLYFKLGYQPIRQDTRFLYMKKCL